MRVHVVLPSESVSVGVQRVAELAREAEGLGYAGVWLPDHLLPPAPYGKETGYGGVYEPLVTLAYLAGVTERVTLGTSVVIAPLRDPLTLARQSATLAQVSGGRFVLGVGVGWQRYEFEAAGEDFGRRGARTDSALRVVRHLHTHGGGPYQDAFLSFDERAVFEPVPEEPVPFLIGGNSDAALRRAARIGDRWQAVGLSPQEFSRRRQWLLDEARRPVSAGARMDWAEDGGDLREALAEVREWEAAGAEDLYVWFGDAGAGFGERMRALAEGVGMEV